jgi:hypothetical protein
VSLSKLLPTLDNAGRRLVLAEILGQPVSFRLAMRFREISNQTSNRSEKESQGSPITKTQNSRDRSTMSATQSNREED